jgi:hypothetical protein
MRWLCEIGSLGVCLAPAFRHWNRLMIEGCGRTSALVDSLSGGDAMWHAVQLAGLRSTTLVVKVNGLFLLDAVVP